MELRTHSLKTWPQFFNAVRTGQKTFEVRKNDRNFKPDDIVELKEWNPVVAEYTGRAMTFQIGFVVKDMPFLQEGYCAFSLIPVSTIRAKIKAILRMPLPVEPPVEKMCVSYESRFLVTKEQLANPVPSPLIFV